jgi:hypothetical protein
LPALQDDEEGIRRVADVRYLATASLRLPWPRRTFALGPKPVRRTGASMKDFGLLDSPLHRTTHLRVHGDNFAKCSQFGDISCVVRSGRGQRDAAGLYCTRRLRVFAPCSQAMP